MKCLTYLARCRQSPARLINEDLLVVKTASTMLPLGSAAPSFSLPNVDGRTVSLKDLTPTKGLVVIFMCNHCPFVKHLRSALAEFGKECQAKGVAVVGISSNDVASHPEDSPAKMAEEHRSAGYTFPYLYDATQNVAKAYRAACTPDFYLFDGDLSLVYRGQFDSSRPGNGKPVTGADLRGAVDALLAGKSPLMTQRASIGCNIKWLPGREPDYFTGQAAQE
jgi:peroxiredoxin